MHVVAGLFMLSALVVVHEFGHFLVARLFGVGVPVFSVGMGPRLFGVRWRGTDYRLSALPVGGYVQMSGADPFGGEDYAGEEGEDWIPAELDFMKKPVWQRLLIMFAGPGFNLALPFVVFTAVLMAGEPQPDPVVGLVYPGGVAAEMGLAVGDRLTSVNGVAVDTWTEVAFALEGTLPDQVPVSYERDGASVNTAFLASAVETTHEGWVDLDALGLSWRHLSTRVGVDDASSPAGHAGLVTGDGITQVDGVDVETWEDLTQALATGLTHTLHVLRAEDGEEITELDVSIAADAGWTARPGDAWSRTWGLAPIMLFVRGFTEDSASEDAGIQLGDRLFAVDGVVVRGWWDLVDLIGASAPPPAENEASGCGTEAPVDAVARPLTLDLIRDGESLQLTLQPRMRREVVRTLIYFRPLIGVMQDPNAYVMGGLVQKRYSLGRAAARATEEVGAIFSGTLTVLGQFATGPRKLNETLGGPVAIFTMAGDAAQRSWFEFLRFMGGISIGLGLVNLLPVPVLDGGHIVFYAIEGLRGRPLSLRLRERVQMVGVLFLVGLILVVTFNDVTRWLGSSG